MINLSGGIHNQQSPVPTSETSELAINSAQGLLHSWSVTYIPKQYVINSSKTGIHFLKFRHRAMSRKLCNSSRFDRRIFTLNLTIERKTLEHATWSSFVVHIQYVSLVSIPLLRQCTHACSTTCSASRSSYRPKCRRYRQTTLIANIYVSVWRNFSVQHAET